ncbi:MAG: bifunctional riboflavin kinase/FAD synthetase [Desulfovibrio sp.]|jgi:riboflavin kinase/FMN adenylyltransferase|nr:bifunctional riboflavin kinase/FAD synthetase [Desulfovibrio sp.]
MRIITDINALPAVSQDLSRGSVLTLGNFDGVHLGHQALILTTIAKAKKLGLPALAVTFDPHPLRVLKGDAAPLQLLSLQCKLEYFAALGLDLALVLHFTTATATMEADDFVRDILCDSLHSRFLVLGYDYAFGKGRRGNAALLGEMGKILGFGVKEVPALLIGDKAVSSTSIRKSLQAGAVRAAASMLGRPHFVQGKVGKGDGRGHLLGFPTANLLPDDNILLPRKGVYAVLAEINPPELELGPQNDSSRIFQPGIANVGENPTFGGVSLRVETHLLNFNADLYDQTFRVHFIEGLREERKFASADELIQQIHHDVQRAKEIMPPSL